MSNLNLSDTAGDISTMLFGSASGGLSSKLYGEGGAFRKCPVDIFSERASMRKEGQGVATGLTVSALNHVAHKILYNRFVRKIDESISEQGLNPEAPVISEEYAYMREFTESNKVLSKLLNKANKTFHVLFRDVFDYPKDGYDSYDTKRFVYITKVGKAPTGNSLEIGDASVNHRVVAIYKSAFLSNRGLALAIGSGLKFHGFFNSYNSVLPMNLFQGYHNKRMAL